MQPSPATGPCEKSETVALKQGVYSFRYGLYSTLFIVADGGVIVFDPIGNRDGCLAQAIASAAPGLSVQHVIYSHGHHDHVAGAATLPLAPGVHVYAHRQANLDLLRQGNNAAVLPVTDVLEVNKDGSDQPLLLTLLGKRIALYYLGPTESSGNLLIHLPDDRVAMLVDILYADTLPGTVLAAISPQGVLRTLRLLSGLAFDKLVVGHGPPASPRDVAWSYDYWTAYLSWARLELLQHPPVLADADAISGAPVLKIMQQLPVSRVVEDLRPFYGTSTGFDSWCKNGFNFAYLYLLSEADSALSLRDVAAPGAPPTQWERVGEGAYYAQAGPYGSLVYDPDPKGGQAPLLIVDTLGQNAAFLRSFLDSNLHGRKIGHIVYSHAHNDHIAFAGALADDLTGVRIYAHENAARDLKNRQNPSVMVPTDIVTGSGMDLSIAGQTVKLMWLGPNHSDGDLVVYLPGSKVVMAVGLVQKGTLPGLLSVATDPQGLHATLSALSQLDAQIYLTGQGGYLNRDEFGVIAKATRDMLLDAAAAMNQAALNAPVPGPATPVAPALRQLIDSVGATVEKSLAQSYQDLQGGGLVAGNVGELGVTYCNSQSPSVKDCEVR